MRIFSIKEITDATIKLLDSDTVVKSKNNYLKNQKKLTSKTEKKISDKEKNILKNKNIIQNTQKPLVVKNEILENPNYQVIPPNYKNKISVTSSLSETEAICKKIVSLPLYPELSEEDQTYVIKKIKDYFLTN